METTQHTPADVRERIKAAIREGVRYVAKADGAYLYEPSVDETADRILALLRAPRGEGEGDALGMLQASEDDVGEVCDLCGEEFDPRESGTVIGPLGQDDGVPRWYRCPRCARAYDAGYQQGQRDPRGDEAADPTALRSDAQEKEDALVCASCGESIGDEPTVIWQDAYTHYRCTPEDAIRDDTPVIRPIDAARRGEGGSNGLE